MENDEKVISVSKEFYEDYILEADIVIYLLLNSLSFFSKKESKYIEFQNPAFSSSKRTYSE